MTMKFRQTEIENIFTACDPHREKYKKSYLQNRISTPLHKLAVTEEHEEKGTYRGMSFRSAQKKKMRI